MFYTKHTVTTRQMRPYIAWFALLFFGIATMACGEVREVSGVYTENLQTLRQDERDYALRMTIFEYDGYVGGWLEYYGFGDVNREDAPYIQPDYCAYFGPFRRAEELTVVRAKSPEGARHILLRMEPDGRRILHAKVENDGGIYKDGVRAEELIFEKQRDAPSEGCPTHATVLTSVALLQHVSTERSSSRIPSEAQ